MHSLSFDYDNTICLCHSPISWVKKDWALLKLQVKRTAHLIFTYLEPSCTHQSSGCPSASRWHRKPPPSLPFPLALKTGKRQEAGSLDPIATATQKTPLHLTAAPAFLFGKEAGRKPRIWIANTPFQCPLSRSLLGGVLKWGSNPLCDWLRPLG